MNLQVLRLPSVAATALRCCIPGVPCHSANAHVFAASLNAALRAERAHSLYAHDHLGASQYIAPSALVAPRASHQQ